MKALFIIFVCLFLSCSNTVQIKNKIVKLEVKKVYSDIDSDYAVKCNEFETYFKDEIRQRVILQKDTLNKMGELLLSIKNDTSKTLINYNEETRAKIIIFYERQPNDTLCISFVPQKMLFNGAKIKFNWDIIHLCKAFD